MVRLTLPILVGLILTPAVALAAPPRIATCEVNTVDGSYKGPCTFEADPRQGVGTFTVSRGAQDLIPGMASINVHVIRPGVAVIKQMSRKGEVTEWGRFQRGGKGQSSCWLQPATEENDDAPSLCVR